MRNKIHTSLTLDPRLVHRLDQAAADRDRSRSWLAGRAIDEFLKSDGGVSLSDPAPLGGGWTPAMPGPPPVAAGRESGHSSPREAPPSSLFLDQESTMPVDNPHQSMMDACVSRTRRLQEETVEKQRTNQDTQNRAAGSPNPLSHEPRER